MDRLIQEIELAREELTPDWTPERSARLLRGAQQLGRKRIATRVARGAGLALAAAVLLGVFEWRQTHVAPLPLGDGAVAGRVNGAAGDSVERSGHRLRLADGSHAELVGAQSELEVAYNTKERVALSLVSGRAHFDVVHDPLRSFVVEARPYRVEVIGTVFDVERNADEIGVSVTRGKVRVYGPHGAEDIVAGQIKHWPAVVRAQPAAQAGGNQAGGNQAGENDSEAATATTPEDAVEDLGAPDEHTSRARARSVSNGNSANAAAKRNGAGAEASWRSLSQSGQYDAAFEALRQIKDVDNDPDALMDAADAARLSGHAQNAVQYLARVVSEHRKSPVAPLAAFTLGRVYLDKLGQPDKAAEAFEAARALSPNGSLAQDALAREVEALSKGGNAQKAYVRAQEYLKRYPNGRRLRAVQLYGGIE